jgi:hypothetical protein
MTQFRVRQYFFSSIAILSVLLASAFAKAQNSSRSASISDTLAMNFTPTDTIPDGYRHFIMPSAKPIQGGYAGFWELGFLNAGVGIGDVLSLAGGFTILPTVAFKSQIGYLQAKLTAVDEGPFSFAAGLNFLRMTSSFPYLHLFAEGTYEFPSKVRVTGLFMYKLSGNDFPIVNIIPYGSFIFSYGGPVGGGIGFDMPTSIPNLRLIGEAWNHDLSNPSKLAAMIGLRVENSRFSSDFGLMYFSEPLLVPVANFVWRF